ncbi:MAG: HAD family hydrolase [Phycisphaerae bacterium]|nr:HAD family hydrolase [Phycisphaerae bacterium]
MLECLIFDMDDTLYDEINYCRSGYRVISHAISAMLAPGTQRTVSSAEIFDFIWNQFQNGDRSRIFNDTLDNFYIPYDSKVITDLVKIYRDHSPIISLDPADADILTQLRGKYKLALLSDGFLPAQQLKADALGLDKYFDMILFTESIRRDAWKPSPLGYQKILTDLNITTNCWAYIADNETKDFIYPNAAGATSIKLNRPNKVHIKPAPNLQACPQYSIDSLAQLPQILSSLT